MQESNPSRNTQLETHPKDERADGPMGWRLHRSDRFPNASKTHQEMSRSILVSRSEKSSFLLGVLK